MISKSILNVSKVHLYAQEKSLKENKLTPIYSGYFGVGELVV